MLKISEIVFHAEGNQSESQPMIIECSRNLNSDWPVYWDVRPSIAMTNGTLRSQ